MLPRPLTPLLLAGAQAQAHLHSLRLTLQLSQDLLCPSQQVPQPQPFPDPSSCPFAGPSAASAGSDGASGTLPLAAPTGTTNGTAAASGPLVVLDGAIPVPLLAALRHAFRRGAPYWAAHAYSDPLTPYQSYRAPLSDSASPASAVEQLGAFLLGRLRLQWPQLRDAAALEWWAHCRSNSEAHHLHWDCDEAALASSPDTRSIRHPIVSTVLYLWAPEASLAGPTVVIDQTLGRGVPPGGGRAWHVGRSERRCAACFHCSLSPSSPRCCASALTSGWWPAAVRRCDCTPRRREAAAQLGTFGGAGAVV